MTLVKKRRLAADKTRFNYDFEGWVGDYSDWDIDGNIWTCEVYVENVEEYELPGTFIPFTFTVCFYSRSDEVKWYESCISN